MGALKQDVETELARAYARLHSLDSRISVLEQKLGTRNLRSDPLFSDLHIRSDSRVQAVVVEMEFLSRQHAYVRREIAYLESKLALMEWQGTQWDEIFAGQMGSVVEDKAESGSLAGDTRHPAQKTSGVRPAPGHHLLVLAELLFSRAAFEGVLQPTILDMREEYNSALADERPGKARLVRIRGTWAFLKAAGLVKILELVKSAARIWSAIP